MQFIGKSKISPLYSKGKIIYPQIRLPQRYKDIIGEAAYIFELEHNDKKAFLVVTGKHEKSESIALEIEDKVLKPALKVLKQNPGNDVESRLSALKLKINELIKFNFQNSELLEVEKEKTSGLEAIRTPDLRHVKAPYTLGSEVSDPRCLLSHEQVSSLYNGLSELDLSVALDELNSYVEYRNTELTRESNF